MNFLVFEYYGPDTNQQERLVAITNDLPAALAVLDTYPRGYVYNLKTKQVHTTKF